MLGFLIAAPVGPLGLLTISRTLSHGRAAGLLTGLGAASADALYGVLAVCGATGAAQLTRGADTWMRVGGASILIWLGLRLLLGRGSSKTGAVAAHGGLRTWLSAFLLTLANPMTIVSFAAFIGAFGAAGDPAAATLLVAGVFTGSMAWWLLLSCAVAAISARAGRHWIPALNRVCGALLAIVGARSLFA